METPRINPVGIVEVPESWEVADDGEVTEDGGASSRSFSRAQRIVAGTFLVFFFAATVVTTVLSVGSYCLTSDGANTRALHESVEQWNGGRGGETSVDR